MAFIGVATVSPAVLATFVDQAHWRIVVFSDTTLTKEHFFRAIETETTKKRVLFVFGVILLPKLMGYMDKFASVVVVDDVQNLHTLAERMPTFRVVDIIDGMPAPLPPADFQRLIGEPGGLPQDAPLMTSVTAALSTRKPSVLETTNKARAGSRPTSGIQGWMTDVGTILAGQEGAPPFVEVTSAYAKYILGIISTGKLNKMVGNRMPEAALPVWEPAVAYAKSRIGATFQKAFRSLCASTDPTYRVTDAIRKFGLRHYSGDFIYLTSIITPAAVWLPDCKDPSAPPLVQETPVKPSMSGRKKKALAKKTKTRQRRRPA